MQQHLQTILSSGKKHLSKIEHVGREWLGQAWKWWKVWKPWLRRLRIWAKRRRKVGRAASRVLPRTAIPGETATLRWAILSTQVFFALALAVLLPGSFPFSPTGNADFSEQEALRETDTALLTSYGWIDQESNIVRIPVREAMRSFAAEGDHTETTAERGRAIFEGQAAIDHPGFTPCRTCHYIEASQGVLVGPNLDGVPERAASRVAGLSAEEYLRQSITSHDKFVVEGFEEGLMLSIVGEDFGNILHAQDIDDLVAYLMTLHEGAAAEQEPLPTLTRAPDAPTTEAEKAGLIDPEVVEADAEGMVQVSDNGYAFQVPDGWQTHSYSGKIATRPEQADFNHGSVIALHAGTREDLNIPNVKTSSLTTTEAFFQTMFERFDAETAAITLEDITEVTIDGNPGRLATIRGSGFGDIEGEVEGRLAAALTDEGHVFVMIGLASPPAQWTIEAEFAAILQSVTLNPPPPSEALTPPSPRYARVLHSATILPCSSSEQMQVHEVAAASPAVEPLLALADSSIEHMEWEAPRPLQATPVPHHQHPIPATGSHHTAELANAPLAAPLAEEIDRSKGPRFSCVHCHITHDVTMLHDSNPSCISCHSGTSYQRHCVDCHSIHGVRISHEPENPGCAVCHPQNIPGKGVDIQLALVTFLAYLFHEI